MAATAPRWTRLDHDERRAQILAAARRLFSERPPASVSMVEVAREAGVARGLLHHYFGTKRDLYLEVIRSMLALDSPPPAPAPEPTPDRAVREVLDEALERWLTMAETNRAAWLASVGGSGPGNDPDVEAMLEEGREQAVDRLVAAVGQPDLPTLRAVLRAYSSFAETASLEWLVRNRLTRQQTHDLLLNTLMTLIEETPTCPSN